MIGENEKKNGFKSPQCFCISIEILCWNLEFVYEGGISDYYLIQWLITTDLSP